MAVEAMARRGRGGDIQSWCDRYVARLDERPRGIEKIEEEGWRDPLGDPVRTGNWLNLFDRAVRERPWQDTPGDMVAKAGPRHRGWCHPRV
jgi:hypothetical protein